MVTAQNLFSFWLDGIINEPLQLDMWNFVWRQITNVPTNCVWNRVSKSTITNMV